jgi:hypothetical protein
MKTLLRGGRVLDPGTGLDAVADVLLDGGTVAAVGPDLDPGDATVVDVSGLVVGPGFIDLHSHVHTVVGQRLQAFDGVTTALELEAGLSPVGRAHRQTAAEGRPLNYGYSASWASARGQALLGLEQTASFPEILGLFGREDWQRDSSPAERTAWLGILERELEDGALGIGILLGYAPQTDPGEYLDVARLAASAGAPTFTHVRELAEVDPTTPIDGSLEITIAAGETGAAMHHCHINSTSRRHIERVLGTISASQAAGSRVSIEAYPWGAGATAVGAYFLAPERLEARGMTPSDIIMVATGERIANAERLREIRETDPGAPCLPHYLDEGDPRDLGLLRMPFEFPDAIPASDAFSPVWSGDDGFPDTDEWPMPPGGRVHPRSGGTFTKAIRMMVRDSSAWTWLEAFRRCSYLPARVLDDVAPVMRRKGHLGVGADADVVVLDPRTVSELATYADPTRPAQGVRHLLVNGTFVIRDGLLDPSARPGRGVRGTPA